MKYYLIILLCICSLPGFCVLQHPKPGTAELTGGFWKERQDICFEKTVSQQYDKLQETGRLEVLGGTWQGKSSLSEEERQKCIRNGAPHFFWDSDTAKWMEAAAYAGRTKPVYWNMLNEITEKLDKLQQTDGYINSYFTLVEPDRKWASLHSDHELYCAGHLIEAVCAYYEMSGRRELLDKLCRYADLLCSLFGPEEGQMHNYGGHPEIEPALIRLYGLTGKEEYLRLAEYFVNIRGTLPHAWDGETGQIHDSLPIKEYVFGQAHKPVREQQEAEGHSVRAMYLYCAMTDLASLRGDKSLEKTVKALWKDVTEGKQYITGGIGSDESTEGFARSWELPNDNAYCESCANIAFVMWAQKMLEADPKAVYREKIEQVLYNVFPASIGADGVTYNYVNPMESRGDHRRWDWFGCACCPPNIARLIGSLDSYVYSYDEKGIYVNQYMGSRVRLNNTDIEIITYYPFDEKITIKINGPSDVYLPMPSWCKPSAQMNGKVFPLKKDRRGYVRISGGEEKTLELVFPLKVRFVTEDERVEACRGKMCVMRGPVVYCAEGIDNGGSLEGLEIIPGPAVIDGSDEYHKITVQGRKNGVSVPVVLVPYALWNNRGEGEMKVWPDAAAQ